MISIPNPIVISELKQFSHLNSCCCRHLRTLVCCGHNSQIMNIHELPVQLDVGADGPTVGINVEHVLGPGVDQGHHAVGQVLALGVRGLDGGHSVLFASLLPNIDVVMGSFKERRISRQSPPHP